MRKQTIKQIMIILIATVFLICLYVFGVKKLELLARKCYYNLIVRNLAKNKTQLLKKPFLLGIYRPELPYQFGQLYTIQESLGVEISIVSYYQAWGDGDEYDFNLEVNKNLSKGNFIPLITWEPWISAFTQYKNKKTNSSLSIIATGKFDYYIKKWAQKATIFGKPFFVRIGHEMSNPWYSWSSAHGNTPQDYKKFWCHVYKIFKEQGAKNVAFIWTPFEPKDTVFYPGNDFVDWIGLDVFNFGSLSQEGTWMDFYIVTKLLYDAVKKYNKPIIIAEAGCASSGGNKSDWYRNMFHDLAMQNFPLIKGLVLFDTPHGTTPTGLPVDLGFSSDSEVYSKINKEELVSKIKINALNKRR
jgi:hypothetical protein